MISHKRHAPRWIYSGIENYDYTILMNDVNMLMVSQTPVVDTSTLAYGTSRRSGLPSLTLGASMAESAMVGHPKSQRVLVPWSIHLFRSLWPCY